MFTYTLSGCMGIYTHWVHLYIYYLRLITNIKISQERDFLICLFYFWCLQQSLAWSRCWINASGVTRSRTYDIKFLQCLKSLSSLEAPLINPVLFLRKQCVFHHSQTGVLMPSTSFNTHISGLQPSKEGFQLGPIVPLLPGSLVPGRSGPPSPLFLSCSSFLLPSLYFHQGWSAHNLMEQREPRGLEQKASKFHPSPQQGF